MPANDLSWRVFGDAGEEFEGLTATQGSPRAVVLFAVGAGGDPNRHRPLLQSLAARGCTVVAPRFARFTTVAPSADELASRARRLQIAFDDVAAPDVPGVGVGHSIGAALLLMLAGAEALTFAGEAVRVPPERRLARLALMAPPTDFFRAREALRELSASVVTWAGSKDDVTPPESALRLIEALQGIAPAEVRMVADAGHFSFMDAPPSHVTDTMADRVAFLRRLAEDVGSFAAR